ncbi:hypothetical protein, partial [Robbsia andropogonis]|uniref:hypothetical protein n=1 Tax=Robbsia andropogonis TaxID=28092 RepID=UPI0020A17161
MAYSIAASLSPHIVRTIPQPEVSRLQCDDKEAGIMTLVQPPPAYQRITGVDWRHIFVVGDLHG